MEIWELDRLKKKYIVIDEIELSSREKIEMLIFLINHLKISSAIENYYLVLGGRGLITRHNFNASDYLIQNARILLKTINQKKVYVDGLKEYENDESKDEKIYIREKDKFILRENLKDRLKKKEELYLQLLSMEIREKQNGNDFAFKQGKKYAITVGDEGERIVPIEIGEEVKPYKLSEIKPKTKKKIKIDIKSLVEEGEEIDRLLSKNQPYRKKVIENNTVKSVNKGKIEVSQFINIENITNVVGQVAAGKSTFSDAIVRKEVKENIKIVIIETSVRKVLEKGMNLEKVGINTAPVIGKSSWREHIEKANDGKDYLDYYDSKVLTAGCILGGFIKEKDVEIKYGQEPCEKIYKYYEKGEKIGRLNTKKKYKCPFYYQCPTTKNQLNILNSEVIVTTTAGLINTTIGISGMTLFQYVLENVDLVIVDEAESELQKADRIFSPIISYDEYIRNNSDIGSNFYSRELVERTTDSGQKIQQFLSLHTESSTVFTKIHDMLKSNKQGFAKSELEAPFSGQILIKKCRDKALLSKDVIAELSNMVGLKANMQYQGIMKQIVDVNNRNQLKTLFYDYGKCLKNELDTEESNRMIFIISILYFESLYRKISNLVEDDDQLPLTTKEVLSQRFEVQQRYIPMAPIGNIFGLQYKERAEIGKPDLYIIKQFALGRSMYLRFPWLKLDKEGNPTGPNVLLLSGSSFAPLSFSNHINEHVNYIIEAEKYKRDFISRSHFEFVDLGVNVSGSGDKREDNLLRLISESKELIFEQLRDKNNTILMIVNSYKDAEIAMNQLKSVLKNTDYVDSITYLVSDSDIEDEDKIKQSKVHQFNKRKSKILIAPAILIERGHNIVDENGNAAFDTVMFLTRPMGNPSDYESHVPKVNGHIMSTYSNKDFYIDTEVFIDIRRKANGLYNKLDSRVYSLSQLEEELQYDIVVTLFVMLLQIFGRLCRVGNEENLKEKSPEVYFLDSAFKAKNKNGFDFLALLVQYLDRYMNNEGVEGEVTRTLYEPFYNALKKGRNIL